MHPDEAQRYLISHCQESKIKKFDILDLNLPTYIRTLFFRDNSPFIIKFAELNKRVHEFGLDKQWESKFRVTVSVNKLEFDSASNDNVLVIALFIILIFGFIISFITFFIELTGIRLNLAMFGNYLQEFFFQINAF